ncbi:MAG: ribonuclease PH [Planctomycetes bacterium]|nr:ribonuclease PH [Planctomycetota bacterium]
MRNDGRQPDALRPISFERNYTMHADGSVLTSFGNTKVLCTVCCLDDVPRWRKGKGGWLTAEYDMLPSSTSTRKDRAASRGKMDGRGVEIQRLIGRSLRGIIDLDQIEDVTLQIDCDVIQADGGTRTAAITGAYVALHDACMKLKEAGKLKYWPLIDGLSAISVGVIDGTPMLDLDYSEDVRADVDMNVVMRANGEFVEVQGTGEGRTFDRATLDQMLDYASKGCRELIALQNQALGI